MSTPNKGRRLERHNDCIYFTGGTKNHIFTFLNGHKQRALLDTGATQSCISETLFNKFKHKMQQNPPLKGNAPRRLMTAEQDKYLQIVSTADLDVKLNGYIIVHTFLIVKGLSHPCIIGMDFMQATNAVSTSLPAA